MTQESEIIGRDGLRGDGAWSTRLSRVASLVLHPFFMPFYGVLTLFALDVMPMVVVEGFRLKFVLMSMAYTMLFPWISLLVLRLVGLVATMSVNIPRQRILPMSMLIVCYVSFILAMGTSPMLGLVRAFMVGASLCVLSALIVTLWWKISLHLISAGGAVALALFLALMGVSGAVWVFAGVVLCAGALASARLHLGSHTPMQIVVGFATGFSLVMLSLLLV